MTGRAVPSLDAQHVDLREVQGFARIGAVADHPAFDLTVRADRRSRKDKMRKLIEIRVDITTKVGYNHRAVCACPT